MEQSTAKKPRHGTETRRLSKLVTVRYQPGEHGDLSERASTAGLTLPSYIREITLPKEKRQTRSTRRPPIEREMAARLLGQLGKIGGNLHQVVKAMNFGQGIDGVALVEVMAELAALDELKRALMTALGRKAA
jgi:hypothetical protein